MDLKFCLKSDRCLAEQNKKLSRIAFIVEASYLVAVGLSVLSHLYTILASFEKLPIFVYNLSKS